MSLTYDPPYFKQNTSEVDKKLEGGDSNLYYYRNIGLNYKDENEFKYRFDTQLQASTALEKKVREGEIELQAANTRYLEIKDKLSQDLSTEKDGRKALEMQANSKGEEYLKKEVQLTQQVSNLQIKLSESLLEKNDGMKEVNEIRAQNNQIKQSCDNKIKSTKDQAQIAEKFSHDQISLLKSEIEQIRTSSKEDVKKLLAEKDKQLSNYEKALTEMKAGKDDYEKNNLFLKKEFTNGKIGKDNEIKERENRGKEDHTRQIDSIIKEYNDKFQSFDNEKEELVNRHSRMSDDFQKLSKDNNNDRIKIEKDNARLKAENQKLINDNEKMKAMLTKNNIEISKASELNTVLKTQLNEMNLAIKMHFDACDDSINKGSIEYNKDKIEWQKEKQELLAQVDNLNYAVHDLKNENEKYTKERSLFKENMKKYLTMVVDGKMSDIKV